MDTPKVRRKTFKELSALIDDTKAEAATSRTLLRIALAYIEAYAGRFPENVRGSHLRRFRRWRLEDNKRADAWMSAEYPTCPECGDTVITDGAMAGKDMFHAACHPGAGR